MIRVSKPRTSIAQDRVKKIFKPQFLAITIHQEVPKLLLLQEHRGLVAKALDCHALWKAVAAVRDRPPAGTCICSNPRFPPKNLVQFF